MAKSSIFRDFIKALRSHWREALPSVRPINETLPQLPKASSFYAGFSRDLKLHVFLHFQHSSKSWEVGRFAINVILSRIEVPTVEWGVRYFDHARGEKLGEGGYRSANILGGTDKWWHLKKDYPSDRTQAWQASSYADDEVVIAEAISSVTQDVVAVLKKLGVEHPV